MDRSGLFSGCLNGTPKDYDLSDNFYAPNNSCDAVAYPFSRDELPEEHLPKPISDKIELLKQLGSPFVADDGSNGGFPILDWEKIN